jgi:hypothetical protein
MKRRSKVSGKHVNAQGRAAKPKRRRRCRKMQENADDHLL